jgi:hypothetical protein
MWDKQKSITDAYINSYMKLGISEEQKKYVIDAEAALTKILWSEMTKEVNIGDTLIMPDVKEDRRKYLLIRR